MFPEVEGYFEEEILEMSQHEDTPFDEVAMYFRHCKSCGVFFIPRNDLEICPECGQVNG